MNTPRTKKAVRWQPSTSRHPNAEGTNNWGITDPEVAKAFGFLVSYWWHVEEAMTYVLEDLLEGRRNETFSANSAARKIFRTIIPQEVRIKIMTALLEGMPHNANFPDLYDDILSEFQSLNKERNNLVHGSWMTNLDTGDVTVRESSNVPNEMLPPRKITKEYLYGITKRMQTLRTRATLRGGGPISSRGTSLPPRDEQK